MVALFHSRLHGQHGTHYKDMISEKYKASLSNNLNSMTLRNYDLSVYMQNKPTNFDVCIYIEDKFYCATHL